MKNQNKFEIKHQANRGIQCLNLEGYLDAHTAPKLESAIEELMKSGFNKILVNFQDLDYISSAGLGVFMAFIEEIRESGGDIKLTSMKSKIFSVFDLLGFPILFDIETNDESAIAKFLKNDLRKNEE
ncbi:MAG: anti-sigma factor antagonist [Ignavibacteria bacterium]|nr:anti-sigma factor antagonist [Ignavibacteria bacterium]